MDIKEERASAKRAEECDETTSAMCSFLDTRRRTTRMPTPTDLDTLVHDCLAATPGCPLQTVLPKHRCNDIELSDSKVGKVPFGGLVSHQLRLNYSASLDIPAAKKSML